MGTTNIRVLPLVGVVLALVMSVEVMATLTEGGATQAQQPEQRTVQMTRGELRSVDVQAKTLTIKPADSAEQRFQYTDETKITGGKGGAAGLATMNGRQVIVHFTTQGTSRVATEVEIQP